MQPEGMSLLDLQSAGVEEAATVFRHLKHVCGKGSSVCENEKDSGRASEKAQKYGKYKTKYQAMVEGISHTVFSDGGPCHQYHLEVGSRLSLHFMLAWLGLGATLLGGVGAQPLSVPCLPFS